GGPRPDGPHVWAARYRAGWAVSDCRALYGGFAHLQPRRHRRRIAGAVRSDLAGSTLRPSCSRLLPLGFGADFAGGAAGYPLGPGLTPWVTSWNQVLSQLLPTLQTISGVLAPFVQIKYLSQ